MEHSNSGREAEILRNLPTVKTLEHLNGFREQVREIEKEVRGTYQAGLVVGIVIDQTSPLQARIYFDGGRRRKVGDTENILLEAVSVKTSKVVKQGIKIGDLVRTNFFYDKIDLIAHEEEIIRQGILLTLLSFDWEQVIGIT